MSDRDELRDILFNPDAGDDAGPPDGERAAVDAAPESEADEDETLDLSPDELVAESVRQTNAELGIEDEDDDAEAATAEAESAEDAEPDELAALREKARLWEEHEAQQATAAIDAQRQAIVAQAQQAQQDLATTKQRYSAFYQNELVRLLAQVDADAENTPNPEAYRRTNRQAAIDNCRRAEALKLAELDQGFQITYDALNAKYEAIDQQVKLAQQKPAYTDFLFEKLDLPDDPQIRQQILQSGDGLQGETALHAMTRRAREIKWMLDQMASASHTITQAAAEIKGREVKLSQPHPSSATNKPRRAKPVQYAESGPERKKQLASILSLR